MKRISGCGDPSKVPPWLHSFLSYPVTPLIPLLILFICTGQKDWRILVSLWAQSNNQPILVVRRSMWTMKVRANFAVHWLQYNHFQSQLLLKSRHKNQGQPLTCTATCRDVTRSTQYLTMTFNTTENASVRKPSAINNNFISTVQACSSGIS
jgi:hypothetical protein